MYNDYYQFSESPFSVTPDPQFYYSNGMYREAWATLRYGIAERMGFTLIVGEAGTGKTTLLRKALREFPPGVKSAYVSNTLLSFVELLRLTLQDLGSPAAGSDKLELLEELNRYLLDEFDRGHVVALLIDEAQDLSVECLEELRLLGNLETDKHKLLQIVLAGQPAIEERLHRPELLQLAQRIVLRCRLHPIESREVAAYIESRLQTIGRRSAEFFETDAVKRIALYSQGIPRVINILCDNALLTAYAASKFKVNTTMIDEVASDLFADVGPMPAMESANLKPKQTSVRAEPMASNVSVMRPIQTFLGLLNGLRLQLPQPKRAALTAVLLMIAGGLLYSKQANLVEPNRGAKISPPIVIARNESTPSKPPLLDAKPRPFVSNIRAPDRTPVNPTAKLAEANGVASTQDNRAAPAHGSKKFVREAPSKSLAEKLKVAVAGNGSQQPSSFDHFSVVGASFVRSRPASNADIVATLEPGTDISVTGKSGEYLRVRTFGKESISGYVHREDAFFAAKRR